MTNEEYLQLMGTLPRPRPRFVEGLAEQLPAAMQAATQVVLDNPGQFALITAGAIVLTRAAANIVRPRTAVEAFALLIVLQVGLPKLIMAAAERGWIRFYVRDEEGRRVPMIMGRAGEPTAAAADPPPAAA